MVLMMVEMMVAKGAMKVVKMALKRAV